MRDINRILLLSLCFMFIVLTGTEGAQSFQNGQMPCVCLDGNGVVIDYPVNDPASVKCFVCTGESGCVMTDMTLQMCQEKNAAAAAASAVPQPAESAEPQAPVNQEPVQVTAAETAPVNQEPVQDPVVGSAPVIEEPVQDPAVELAPGIEEPVQDPVEGSAPVYEEPVQDPVVGSAPGIEEPVQDPVVGSAPVIEEPVQDPVEGSAPVIEEPVQDPVAELAPVIEEPVQDPVVGSAPVIEEPVQDPVVGSAPVIEEPVQDPVVGSAPVIEEPVQVSAAGSAPVDEEPVLAPVAVQVPGPVYDEPEEDITADNVQPIFGPALMTAGIDNDALKSGGEGGEGTTEEFEVEVKRGSEEIPAGGVEVESDGKPAADGADEPGSGPEVEGEGKSGEKPAADGADKPVSGLEAEGEGKLVEKPAADGADKTDSGLEAEGEGKPGEKSAAEDADKSDSGSVAEGEGKPGEKPAVEDPDKPDSGPEGEGEGKPGEKPAAEDADKPGSGPEGEGEGKPGEKPAADGAGKSDGKPADEGNKEEQPSEPETPERPVDYIVKAGDTCESIANNFGIDYDLFMIMNDMEECSIQVDQSVHIPTVEEEILKAAEEEALIMPMLFSSGISIDGKLKDLGLSSPSGETFTTAAVPFTWVYTVSDDSNPVDITFNLTLVIDNLENGQKTTSTTVVSSASCKNFICTYTAGSELSGFTKANVAWTVSGEYDDGGTAVKVSAANPAEKTFTLDVKDPEPKPDPTPKPPEKPKAPVQECPVGRYTVRSLGFYWAPSENAEAYTVIWYNDREQSGKLDLSGNDPTCKQGRCIAYTTLPGVGKYVWTVTAKNKSGSAQSGEMKFEIATNVSTPTPYLPNGTVFNSTYPAFQWEDVRDGVFEYRIQIVGKYDGRIRYDRWFDVKDIYVGNGVCYVKTDLFLPAGTYSWRVLGRNADFNSRWSSWLDFYVQCDYCNYNNTYFGNYANTVPSTSYPTAVITTMAPEYQWRTLTGAASYQVKVTDAAGNEVFAEQVPSSYCTVEMCTWDPGIKLPGNGKYTWTVSGYGPSGGFWGSSNGSFTVQAQIVIDPMKFVSPEQNGYLNPEAPLIIWTDPGETAVLFSVQIFDGNNNPLLNAELDRDQAWCDGLTCSIAFQTIPDGVNYRIAITPYSEYNTTGDTIELVFSKGGRSIRLASPKEGSVVQSRPLFRWMLEDGVDAAYDLILTDAENNVTIYSPLVCGTGGVTCEDGEAFYSPAEALAAGSYTAVLDIPKAGVNGEAVTFTVQ